MILLFHIAVMLVSRHIFACPVIPLSKITRYFNFTSHEDSYQYCDIIDLYVTYLLGTCFMMNSDTMNRHMNVSKTWVV